MGQLSTLLKMFDRIDNTDARTSIGESVYEFYIVYSK